MDHRPRKRFGQNFLQDPHYIELIVDAACAHAAGRWVEIGPGMGAITRPLLERIGRLDVIEIDRDLAAALPSRMPAGSDLHVHCTDALDFDFSALAGDQTLRVVGNLPYNISTPLIFHLLKHADHIDHLYFLLQREVVDRMVAEPDSEDYGRLSVMVQRRCRAERLFEIPPGAFFPAPQVWSAFIHLEPLPVLPGRADSGVFAALVSAAFSQRRKTLRNSLKAFLSGEELEALGISPMARAEVLSLEDFERLALAYQGKRAT